MRNPRLENQVILFRYESGHTIRPERNSTHYDCNKTLRDMLLKKKLFTMVHILTPERLNVAWRRKMRHTKTGRNGLLLKSRRTGINKPDRYQELQPLTKTSKVKKEL